MPPADNGESVLSRADIATLAGSDGQSPIVLVVDDTPENLVVIGELLRPHYRVRVANSGQRALQIATTAPVPHLILLDVMMPGMDGYAVLEHLYANPLTKDIPVIFVTAMDADEDETRGLELGAVDYITKPIRPAILLARVHAHLELKVARDRMSDQNRFLESEIARRMEENELIKEAALHALASLAEARDPETGNHLRRVQAYVQALAQRLRLSPRYADQLDDARISQIARAAPLHDIGKVGIPDSVLLKPGKLTAEEFNVMKAHPRIGGEAISEAMRRVASDHALSGATETGGSLWAFLETARQIAYGHHEKWDGSGYPQGLAGEAIPLSARLMALADVYDALINRRVYKEAFPIEEAMRILREGRGTHFDPDILDAFLEIEDEFRGIASRYADGAEQ